jgi:tetratricopeptide (TPR) repeat protein
MKKVSLVLLICFAMVVKAKEKQTLKKNLLSIKVEQQEAINKGDLDKFKEVASKLERLSTLGEKEWLVKYYLAFNYYRMATVAEDKKISEKYIEIAKKVIMESIESKKDFADSRALYSTILGYEISFKPQLAMTSGMQSGKEIEEAKKLAPDNPRVYMIEGTNKLYTPAMFGGGVDKAIEILKNSATLFEKEKEKGIYPDWGKEEVYIWLGNAYKEKKEDSTATAFYKKALEINPDCGWAKEILKKDSLKCAEKKLAEDSVKSK